MPGRLTHLAARFVDVVTSRPLTATERQRVETWLGPDSAAAKAYFSQSPADQRHGLSSADYVTRHAPNRPDLVRAALLHDIGKRHAGLGVIERVLASLALRLRIPVQGRWALYRDHGRIAAAELTPESELVRRFALHHHGQRPAEIPPADWDILIASDQARLGRDR